MQPTGNVEGPVPHGGDGGPREPLDVTASVFSALWHAPVGLALFDRDLRYVKVNEALAAANGAPADAHVGRTLGEVIGAHGPPVPDVVARVEETLRGVLEDGRPRTARIRVEATGNDWYCWYHPVRAPDGSVHGVCAMIWDETEDRRQAAAVERARDDAERLRAEAERMRSLLEAVFENAPIGIMFLDRDFRFVRANPALAGMGGVVRDDMGGRSVREIAPTLDLDHIESVWREVLRTGVPAVDVEISGELPWSPGKRQTWTTSSYPVRAGDDILGVGVLVREVTAEREGEEFQRHVLGIVGHDLRNPLSALVTSARMLLRAQELPPDRAKLASRIFANAERMDRMITVLMEYARLRAGKAMPLRRQRSDVQALVDEVADECEASHPGREVRRSGNGDPVCEWDPNRIAQALANLVANALDYSPADTPVDVEWRGEGEDVVLEVSNHGAPIPADVLPHLFEPFRQAGWGRPSAREGLGLGLFIARAIVVAHGGSVEARSGDGDRTVFVLRLPRRAAAPAPAPPVSEPRAGA